MKTIIGYKSPIALYKNQIPAGTVFKSLYNLEDSRNITFAPVINGGLSTNHYYSVPVEIVKTWEPVYEDEFKVGDWVYVKDGPETGQHKQVGDVFKITKIKQQDREDILYFSSYEAVHAVRCRKATAQEIEAAQTKRLVLGTGHIRITIQNGKITADGKDFSLGLLGDYHEQMVNGVGDDISGLPVSWPVIKIGCSTFTAEEIKQIIDIAKSQTK